jgi:hypothetical protein
MSKLIHEDKPLKEQIHIHYQNNQSSIIKPPFRIESLLNLAWGYTLSLSSDEKQLEKGKELSVQIKDVLSKCETYPEHQYFINNLWPLLTSYLRKTGVKRTVFHHYMESVDNNNNQVIEYFKDLANLSSNSISKEGLIFRISSFLGIGSISGLLSLIHENAETTPIESIAPFLLGGMIGMFALIVVVRWWSHKTIIKENRKTYSKKKRFYENELRRKYHDDLWTLREQLNSLINTCYKNYKDDPLLDDYPNVEVYINRIIKYIEGKDVNTEQGQQGKHEKEKENFVNDLKYTISKFIKNNQNKIKLDADTLNKIHKYDVNRKYNDNPTIEDLREDYIDIIIDEILPHESLYSGTDSDDEKIR